MYDIYINMYDIFICIVNYYIVHYIQAKIFLILHNIILIIDFVALKLYNF